MAKYKIFIEETTIGEFEVEANDIDKAFDIATQKYHSGEFVLEPGDLNNVSMKLESEETQEETNWYDIY